MDYVKYYQSPLGEIMMASDGSALTGLWFAGQKYFADTLSQESEERDLLVFELARKWLDIYFDGRIPDFTPPLSMITTDFRKAVWEILLTIPYGRTMTYGEIARVIAEQRGIGRMSAQAVGAAVGHNSISLIIPCHRVIGSDGSLTSYAGGIGRKQWLLDLEKKGIENTGSFTCKEEPAVLNNINSSAYTEEPSGTEKNVPDEKAFPNANGKPASEDASEEAYEVFEEICRAMHGID